MVTMSGVQRQMPRRRSGHTTAVTIGAERFYLTANQRDDGSLGEVFIHWGKHGTSSAGLVSTYAIALSMGLRHRVPLPELIRPGLDQEFMPNGHTNDPEIPRVRSAVDYVARRLAIDWLPYPERAALGVLTRAERVRRRELAAAFNVPALFSRQARPCGTAGPRPAVLPSSSAPGAEGEHFLGHDAGAERVQLIQPGLELRALPGQVVVEHGLAQFAAFRSAQIEQLGPAVHGHGQFLTRQVGRADRGPGGQVPHA